MPEPLVHTPPVTFFAQLAEGHVSQGFDVAVVAHALSHVRAQHLAFRDWTVSTLEQLDAPALTVEASADTMGGFTVIAHAGERELVEVVRQHGAGRIRVAADSHERADELLAQLVQELVEPQRPADPRISVWFWTSTPHGPEPMRRRLHAPTWHEIEANYPLPLREALSRVMQSPPETAQGIALWRGEPGTGKTTALRALAREWQEHVDVHVIVDPEVFLGEGAAYLVQVLFGDGVDEDWHEGSPVGWVGTQSVQYPGVPMGAMLDGGLQYVEAPSPHPRRKAKLIVLEDAGELITAEARVSAGQALSRLLNLTDGMLGQGSNVSVLVTTNESIDALHPAIARPGRGWSHLEFRTLSTGDANAWLERAGSADRVTEPTTVAELYSIVRGDRVVTLDQLEE